MSRPTSRLISLVFFFSPPALLGAGRNSPTPGNVEGTSNEVAGAAYFTDLDFCCLQVHDLQNGGQGSATFVGTGGVGGGLGSCGRNLAVGPGNVVSLFFSTSTRS